VSSRSGNLYVLRQLLVDRLQIGKRELRVDRLDIGNRIDLTGDVYDVVIRETAHDMCHSVGLAYVRQELVAEAFSLRCTSDEPRDVDEFDDGRNHFLRLGNLRQLLQSGVRYRYDADVRLDRAKGVVLRRDAGFGKGVEQSGLAHVGQSDDTALEAH